MKGKEKCKALKEIRRKIAENNDIKYVVEECQHKGDCKGTCPKCESELRYLERELEKRAALGKAVAFAGISLGIASTFTACTAIGNFPYGQVNGDMSEPPIEELSGDVPDINEPINIDNGINVDHGDDGEEIILDGDVDISPEYYDGNEDDGSAEDEIGDKEAESENKESENENNNPQAIESVNVKENGSDLTSDDKESSDESENPKRF